MAHGLEQEIATIVDGLVGLHKKSGDTGIRTVKLTKGDGTGTLFVTNGQPREVWVHDEYNHEQFSVYYPPSMLFPFVDGDTSIENYEVRISKPPGIADYVILDALTLGGREGTGDMSLMEAQINTAYWPALQRITNLRARPTDPVSTSIAVDGPFPYINTSGNLKIMTSTLLAALSATIAALAAGKHQLCIVYFNRATGALGTTTNTAVTATGSLPARDEWLYTDVEAMATAWNTSYIPIEAVYLYKNQASIVEADFYRSWDLRPIFGGQSLTLPLSMTNGGTGSNLSTADGFLRAIGGATIPYKWKLNGTAAPGVTDDANAGWAVGSIWFDTTNNKVYSCTANTVGAAVWPELTGGGGGAPTTATYITQTPDAGLSAEQALSALATGYMKVTTTTGIVSSQVVPIPEADGGTARTTGAATKALDNLASTAVNADILPASDNTKNVGSSTLRYSNIWSVNTLNDVNAIPVKNVSGATANANEVGILQYDTTNGYSYTTTTTANLFAQWCVVIVGAANNSTIYVATRGKVTVKLNANCAIKDFLLTSTTAGQASVSTTMRPEIFAVALTANSGGAGGTCTAQLLCNTTFIPAVSSNLLWGCYNHSASDFVSTINGVPTATSVVYGAVSSGAANAIVPANAGDLGKMILWNTTRSTGRLITAVNTGTSTITTVSTTDSWANTDAITIRSQTVINAAAARFVDVDLSQQTTIPTLARNIWIMMQKLDSGGGNITQIAHPWETIASSKNKTLWYQTTNFWIDVLFPLPLINGRFAVAYGASGSGTALDEMYLQGYSLATP